MNRTAEEAWYTMDFHVHNFLHTCTKSQQELHYDYIPPHLEQLYGLVTLDTPQEMIILETLDIESASSRRGNDNDMIQISQP